MIESSLVFNIGIVIVLATAMAFISRIFKQPLIPAYVLTGLILGPIGLGLIKDVELIRSLSEIGIAFLLFIVGLEIDLKKLKEVGSTALISGLIQVVFIFSLGYSAAFYYGFNSIASLYIGIILAFSSTMIVIKLLSDRDQLDTLHGRIILGILILQDLLVIVALAFLTAISSFSYLALVLVFVKTIILLIIAMIGAKYIFPALFDFAARSRELLFLSAIAVLFFYTIVSNYIDFSMAIGAFIAGISLASLPYNYNVVGSVSPLKDFFSTIFFVSLGMQLVWINTSWITPMVIFLLIVVLVKPLIIMILVSLFGYEKRTSFLSGISLGQVSEFSFTLISLGFYVLSSNYISQEFFSMVIFLTVITMVLTSYMINYSNNIYNKIYKSLRIFDRFALEKRKLEYVKRDHHKKIILFGCHRMGGIFLNALEYMGKNALIVDNDPEKVKYYIKKKNSCIYGDMVNVEVLNKLKLKEVKMVISTVPNLEDTKFLIDYVKKVNKKATLIVVADHLDNALDLYEMGADYVVLPHVSAGEMTASLLKKVVKNKNILKKERAKHITHLLHMESFGR